jgi:allantoinase
VHVVHLSSASALPALRAARAEGLPVTVETCPHYLCLDAESVADGATEFKCAPPIRDRGNRDRLWEGLLDGTLDCVVSDHSPCTPDLKSRDTGDFTAAWGGIASLQLVLPLLWTEARARGVSIERVAHWLTAGPAHVAGLDDRKGGIAPGLDADLVIWEPDTAFTVEPDLLHFRHKVSPYLGRTLFGRVRATYLRGVPVYDGAGFPAAPVGRPLLFRGLKV